MSRSRMLAYGFGVVLVAAVILVIATRRPAKQPKVAATTPTAGQATGSGATPAKPVPPRAPLVDGKAVPTVTEGINPNAPERTTTSYLVDGKEVHDHRSGTHAPITVVPDYPPDAHRINSAVTRSVTNQLQAAVHECAASVPPEARGPKPKLEGQILIAIAKEQVTVVRTAFTLSDLVGASAEPTQTCIEQKAALITAAAPKEPDIASYPITLSLAII